MNYKNIIAFILLIFTVGCASKVEESIPPLQPSPPPPTWLQLHCKEAKAFYKKITDSYIKYVDSKGIKRTIIVGAGRGKDLHYVEENKLIIANNNYAASAYKNPNNYLLVDIAPELIPDIVSDITAMDPKIFGVNQYDQIVFENVNFTSSFTKEAAQGAFVLLRKGGKIVSSGIPSFNSKESPNFKINKLDSLETFVFGEGTAKKGVYFRTKNKELCPYVFVNKDERKVYPHWDLSFYRDNVKDCFKFFGLDSAEAKIEFTTVMPGTDEWPTRNEPPEEREVMIITKLK